MACIAFKEPRFYGREGAVSDPIVVSRLGQKKNLSQRPPRLCGKSDLERGEYQPQNPMKSTAVTPNSTVLGQE
jgi:hypothetical protein